MNDEAEKSGTRNAIILAAIVVIVGIYSTTYGLQTLEWFTARRWATSNPLLNQTPQALPAASATAEAAPAPEPVPARGKGMRAAVQLPDKPTAYTYEFSSPWAAKWTEKAAAGWTEFRFDTGQVIVFFNPEGQLDTVRLLQESTSAEYAPLRNLVNQPGMGSNYALYQGAYSVAPAQLSPMMEYATAERDNLLLLTKLSFGFDLDRAIYSFDFGNNKGFQFGDPTHGPVAVRVFNSHDKQFRLIFTVAPGSSGQITQSDISHAVASLQPVPIPER